MKTTITQIASSSGVSPATVSRVLNRRPGVDEQIRQRVIAAARELGYHRRGSSSRPVIALIMPGEHNVFFHGYLSSITTALTEEIFKRGFQLELIPGRDIDLLDSEVVSGAISLTYSDELEKSWGSRFNLPLVCINSFSYHFDGVYSVCSNEHQGMALAVDALFRHGHRRLGVLICGGSDCWCGRERRVGFKAACVARDLTYAVADQLNLYEGLGELIRFGATGIVCTGETAGMIAAYALNSFGYHIPQDLSLIAHELEGVSQYSIPRQTAICQNFRELSRNAVSLLNKLLDHDRSAADILIDYQLIERDTVAAPPSAGKTTPPSA